MKILSVIYLLLFLIKILSLNASDLNGVINYWHKEKNKFSSINIDLLRNEGINYLNLLRKDVGLSEFKENLLLDEAAQNHADYLKVNNTVTHFETEGAPLFTGKTPIDRVFFVGYSGGIVIENISAGDDNIKDSIDNLFSAIYHRFGFLSFLTDEIGIGFSSSSSSIYGTFFVYNMGNSLLRELCESTSYDGQGAYIYGICKDQTKKISKQQYENIIKNIYSSAPKYVIWPYNGAFDIMPAFYEEIPDPLPQCSVSGYPISIQFNPLKIDKETFKLIDFSLYDENNNKINNVTLLTPENDPNKDLDDFEYALMPLERLNWDTTYTAKVIYSESGKNETITWNFHTKKLDLPYFVISGDYDSIVVKPGKYYYLYFKPTNCNDLIMSFNYQYKGKTPTVEFYDGNTLKIMMNGDIGDKVIIYTSNGKTVEITAGNYESESIHKNTEEYCGYINKNLIYLPCVTVGEKVYSLILKFNGGLFFDIIAYKSIVDDSATKCGKFDPNDETLYYPCINIDGFNFWAKFKFTGIGLTFKLIDYGK